MKSSWCEDPTQDDVMSRYFYDQSQGENHSEESRGGKSKRQNWMLAIKMTWEDGGATLALRNSDHG